MTSPSARLLGALALAATVSSGQALASDPGVVLVSWDGAGFEMTTRLLGEGELPNLERMLREGAWTDVASSSPAGPTAASGIRFTPPEWSNPSGSSCWRRTGLWPSLRDSSGR